MNIFVFVMNPSVIGAHLRNVASLAGAGHVTLKRFLRMHTSITASPSATHEVRTFGAGVNVAYACISESKRATPQTRRPRCLGTLYNRRDELHPAQ